MNNMGGGMNSGIGMGMNNMGGGMNGMGGGMNNMGGGMGMNNMGGGMNGMGGGMNNMGGGMNRMNSMGGMNQQNFGKPTNTWSNNTSGQNNFGGGMGGGNRTLENPLTLGVTTPVDRTILVVEWEEETDLEEIIKEEVEIKSLVEIEEE